MIKKHVAINVQGHNKINDDNGIFPRSEICVDIIDPCIT